MTNLHDKLLGCWLGKTVGGILGAPYEGHPYMNDLTFYNPVPQGSEPNDDVELQVMYAVALSEMAVPLVDRGTLSDIWLKHMEYNADEYAVALCNLRNGIPPPWSGRYDNYYTDGMGAAIRSELWASLAPGEPELATRFAREDACIDHAGVGVDAEVFLAALESLAFEGGEIESLIERALGFLPADSALTESIRFCCDRWRRSGDWREVRNGIFERYASEFRADVVCNVPFAVLGLLASGGDFGKGICIAANCGMDTDCTAATAGAVLGILHPEGITRDWLAPIGRGLVVRPNKIVNLTPPPTIDALVDLIETLRGRIRRDVAAFPGFEEPDWSKHAVRAEICFRENIAWYHIPAAGLDWRPIDFPGLYHTLPLPENRGALQVLLRFHFRIEEPREYTILFTSPCSNQVYLDPDWTDPGGIRDDRHMLFGRQRPFRGPAPRRRFSYHDGPPIFSPCLGGAPINQYKRYLRLAPGVHELLVALEPIPADREITWRLGVGYSDTNGFVPGAFRPGNGHPGTIRQVAGGKRDETPVRLADI